MPSLNRDVQMAWVAFVVAALGVGASILLLLMFATEVPYNGPYRYGAGFSVLTAIASVLTALLVVHLSRLAGPSRGERVLAPFLAAMLVVGTGAGILLVTHVVGHVVSIGITIVVLFLQGVWLFWLNRRLQRLGALSPAVSTFGWLIGAGLVIGLPILALSQILPPLTFIQLLVLGFGVFLAGSALLVYPIWWLMIGVWLLRGRRGARDAGTPESVSAADDAAGATSSAKTHGRRRA